MDKPANFGTPGRLCDFDGCEKPHASKGLCASHTKQRNKGRELTPLGDKSVRAASLRAFWDQMSPEERQRRLNGLVVSRPVGERSPEWRQRLSESHKARWQSGAGVAALKPRECRDCGATFQPSSGSHWTCTKACLSLSKRLRRYGLTRADYDRMMAEQAGRCAICGSLPRGFSSAGRDLLHIDHCHETQRPRALLCGDCNTALGRFGDDPSRLRAAADYLERYLDEEA